jgi:phosphoglycerate dehydrogenase-like enzyme
MASDNGDQVEISRVVEKELRMKRIGIIGVGLLGSAAT